MPEDPLEAGFGAASTRSDLQADRCHLLRLEKAAMDAAFEVFRDHSGKFRWRMRARNGAVIAISPREGYSRLDRCAASIKLVRALAADAPVNEQPQLWHSSGP